jgi:hypothetical protein
MRFEGPKMWYVVLYDLSVGIDKISLRDLGMNITPRNQTK